VIAETTRVGKRDLSVLLAEDDLPLANFLQRRLEAESFQVQHAEDGAAATEALKQHCYQMLILDLNLPKMDGIAVLKEVRPAQPRLPIMVLTARTQVEDRVLSLDSGADDCLLKPFAYAEFMARVRSLLRRNPVPMTSRLQVGDLMLDGQEFRVERGGKRINLSGKEFALLEYLMRNTRQAVSRAMIMENVWKMPLDPTTNLVDVYVKYVRDKVDTPEFPTRLIRTVRGVGYVLSES